MSLTINDEHFLAGDNVSLISTPKNKQKFKTGMPDSIIIHYTAGKSAQSSAKYLSRNDVKASAHIVLGRDGRILHLVPFDTVSWHAGRSEYGGRKWYNNFSIGIEIDNAGPLTKVGNEFQSWFGQRYPENEAVQGVHRNESRPRYWHAYTPTQIEVCEDICRLLIEKYNIKSILGHEEIAPGRKQDPGPAFPLDRFRNNLLFNDRADENDVPASLPKSGKVIPDKLNIRAGSGAGFDKVARALRRGTEVEILDEDNGWYKVSTKIEGWVSKGYIEPKSE
ncbi:MAG: N-acetylmuramoyl-L-alanine amidase [Bacteroidota bacterium]